MCENHHRHFAKFGFRGAVGPRPIDGRNTLRTDPQTKEEQKAQKRRSAEARKRFVVLLFCRFVQRWTLGLLTFGLLGFWDFGFCDFGLDSGF